MSESYIDLFPDPTSGETKESLEARRTTSHFANRVHVVVNAGIARLTFGEVVRSGETNWHSSITITAYDALRLVDLVYIQDEADRARYDTRAKAAATAAETYEPQAPPKPEDPRG